MVRKARPQLSVHSVTIRITSAENVTVRILYATYRKAIFIRVQILKNIKKVLRMKTTQGCVMLGKNTLLFVSYPYLIRI